MSSCGSVFSAKDGTGTPTVFQDREVNCVCTQYCEHYCDMEHRLKCIVLSVNCSYHTWVQSCVLAFPSQFQWELSQHEASWARAASSSILKTSLFWNPVCGAVRVHTWWSGVLLVEYLGVAPGQTSQILLVTPDPVVSLSPHLGWE